MELPSDLATLPAITKFIERCTVVTVPAGAAPKDVTIQLPDADGAKVPARYTGFPPGLAVNDIVSVRATPQDTIKYMIVGTSGATATTGISWPFANILTVSTTDPDADYSTIAAANTAAIAGDIILLDAETWGNASITKAVTLMGLDPINTILTTTGSKTINIGANDISLRNLTIENTGTGATHACIQNNFGETGITIDNCILNKISGAATTSYGIYNNGGTGWTINNARVIVTAGTTRYGYRADTNASSAKIIGGSYDGSTDDISLNHASASVELDDPILENSDLNVTLGSATGWYYNAVRDLLSPDNTDGDLFPRGAGHGVSSRFIDNGLPELSLPITDHFRSGVIPTGYAWLGAPFATPGTIVYSQSGDWLRTFHGGAARGFLAKTNNARGDLLFVRIATDGVVNAGLRIDDGTDTNYYEWRIVHVSGGSFVVRLIQTGSANVDTTVNPISVSLTLMLFPLGSAPSPNHTPFCYLVNELGGNDLLTTGALATWTPARVGIVTDNAGALNADWFRIP